MRSDLIGMPVTKDELIFVIRAAWVDSDGDVMLLIEGEKGGLHQVAASDVMTMVPQVMSSHSGSSLTELFPDLLAPFGRREILAIWTLGLGFDGPLRERIKYGIVAFTEGQEGELARMRAERDAGYPGRSEQ